MRTHTSRLITLGFAAVTVAGLLSASGCAGRASGQSGANGPGGPGGPRNGPIAVDVVLARAGTLRGEAEYTGTTRATREVAVRTRTEGRLLNLTVDVGDGVRQGQVIGRLDDSLLRQAVQQAESELLSRQSEVAAARSRVGDAETQVRQAELDLAQKRADFRRNMQLYIEGYMPRREAQQARTNERVAGQVLQSEKKQVQNLQAEVRAAEARVRAQRAVVAQERERLSYANLLSPLSGFVTARMTETGSLLSPGAEVIRIGDFRIVQVDVQISELERSAASVGEPVRLTLDAFPGQVFTGRVDRISPQADPVSRLIFVTITMPNPDLKIGAGLLARVRFGSSGPQRVLIPENAIQRPAGAGGRGGGAAGGAPSGGSPEARAGSGNAGTGVTAETIFVLEGAPTQARPGGSQDGSQGTPQLPQAGSGPAAPGGGAPGQGGPAAGGPPETFTVRSRQVQVGTRADGQAEVVGGLKPGERVVARSARPLKDGDEVVLSALSQEALRRDAEEGEGTRERGGGRGEAAPPAPGLPRGSGAQSPGDAGRTGGAGASGGSGSFGGGARSGSSGSGSFGGSGGGDRPVSTGGAGMAGGSGRRSGGGEITGGQSTRSPFGGGSTGSTPRTGGGFTAPPGQQFGPSRPSTGSGGTGSGFGSGTGAGRGTGSSTSGSGRGTGGGF